MNNNIYFTANLMLFSKAGLNNLSSQNLCFNSKRDINSYKDLSSYIINEWNKKIKSDSDI